jgi:hypothetical protein
MRNALKLLPAVSVLLLAVCSDVPNAPSVTGEATTAAEIVETDNPAQVADESQLKLEAPPTIFLTENDFKVNTQAPLAKAGVKPLPLDVSPLSSENTIIIRKGKTLAKTTALADPGFYQTITGYLTGTGKQAIVYPIPVFAGEVLCIQVDLPNNAQIDYDAYLYLVDALGIATLVDRSVMSTYINGSNGTLPEMVGAYNTSDTTQNYRLLINSYQGGSSTLPYTIHFGIRENNALFDFHESDENPAKALSINLQPEPSSTGVNNRSANTRCDNDWFMFITPPTKNYTSAVFKFDAASISAGYKFEIYTPVSNTTLKREAIDTVGRVTLANNTAYYIRVTSTGSNSLTGSNYSFVIYPDYLATSISMTPSGGGEMATYCETIPKRTLYRVRGGGQLTVDGIVRYNSSTILPYARVNVTFANPHYPSQYGGQLSVTVTANQSGYYTATIPVGPAHGTFECIFGSSIRYKHTYDIDNVTVSSGTAIAQANIFLLATDERVW